MSTETNDKEATKQGGTAWRKVALWIAGALVLAVVGYRGALGTSHADAATLPSSTSASAAGTQGAEAPALLSTASAPLSSTEAAIASTNAAATAVPTGSTSAHAASPAPSGDAAAGAASAMTADGKVILNLATEVELRKLPGIGKARAKGILDLRERLGRFKRVEDLLRVKGIGVRRLAALRPKIVLDPS